MKLYYARRVNKEEKEPGAIEVVEIVWKNISPTANPVT